MTTPALNRTSFSRLSSWLRCPRLHKYRYIDQVNEERASAVMLLGVAFHEAAELLFRGIQFGDPPSNQAVYAAFDRAFLDSIDFNNSAGCKVDLGKHSREGLVERGHEMLRVFLAEVDRNVRVRDIERRFEVEIEPGRSVEGVLDLVLQHGDGVLVVDLKTSANAFGKERLDYDAQATVYSMASRRLYTGQVDFEFWLVTRATRPRFIRYPVVRDAADEAELCELIRDVEAATSFSIFPRRRDWQCFSCEYRVRCTAERSEA